MKIANHKYYIPSGDKFRNKSMIIANAMAIELLNYGVKVSKELLMQIATNKKKVAREFCANVLNDYTVGKLNPPLFKGWESREEFTFDEVVFQIVGYMIQLSGNDLEDPSYMENLLKKVDFKKKKEITLATTEEANALFQSLVSSKVSLDRSSLDTLIGLGRIFGADYASNNKIYSDQARIAVLMGCVEEHGLLESLKLLNCKSSDVLRYAAALVDINTINLPSDVKYAILNWQQRVALLSFLNSFEYEQLFEDTGINRESWIRFFKHIHLFTQHDFINRFPKINFVARISMGHKESLIPAQYNKLLDSMLDEGIIESTESENLVYRTFASRIQRAIDTKDYKSIEKLMNKNGSYLLRNIATVSNGVIKENESSFIELVRSKLKNANVGVLFSVLGINVKAKYRIIDVKGNTVVEKANYPKYIAGIQGDIRRELHRRYGYNGVVKVADDLQNNVVPFLSKNAELDRGTRIRIDSDKYLYMFVHWVQGYKRTDLDLSAGYFDHNWKFDSVYFGQQVNRFITHSGDFTNAPAPNGATEYVKIKLKDIPSDIKYIVPMINVYCGDVFNKNNTVYAGFMTSDDSKFSIKRDHVRYDLDAPAYSNIPFIMDVENNEIILLDVNNRESYGLTIHSEADRMKQIISAVNDKVVITNQVLADILSGDSDEVSLHIKKTAKNENEIEPSNLASLFK